MRNFLTNFTELDALKRNRLQVLGHMFSPIETIVLAINALANEISNKSAKIELMLGAIHFKEMELDQMLFQKIVINLLYVAISESNPDFPININAELVQQVDEKLLAYTT